MSFRCALGGTAIWLLLPAWHQQLWFFALEAMGAPAFQVGALLWLIVPLGSCILGAKHALVKHERIAHFCTLISLSLATLDADVPQHPELRLLLLSFGLALSFSSLIVALGGPGSCNSVGGLIAGKSWQWGLHLAAGMLHRPPGVLLGFFPLAVGAAACEWLDSAPKRAATVSRAEAASAVVLAAAEMEGSGLELSCLLPSERPAHRQQSDAAIDQEVPSAARRAQGEGRGLLRRSPVVEGTDAMPGGEPEKNASSFRGSTPTSDASGAPMPWQTPALLSCSLGGLLFLTQSLLGSPLAAPAWGASCGTGGARSGSNLSQALAVVTAWTAGCSPAARLRRPVVPLVVAAVALAALAATAAGADSTACATATARGTATAFQAAVLDVTAAVAATAAFAVAAFLLPQLWRHLAAAHRRAGLSWTGGLLVYAGLVAWDVALVAYEYVPAPLPLLRGTRRALLVAAALLAAAAVLAPGDNSAGGERAECGGSYDVISASAVASAEPAGTATTVPCRSRCTRDCEGCAGLVPPPLALCGAVVTSFLLFVLFHTRLPKFQPLPPPGQTSSTSSAVMAGADASMSVRVVNLNVYQGFNRVGGDSRRLVAGMLHSLWPDVVVLQETDIMRIFAGSRDYAYALGWQLAMDVVPGLPLTFDSWGCLILSPFKVLSWHAQRLPSPNGENACYVHALLEAGGGSGGTNLPLHVVNVHLGNRGTIDNELQVNALIASLLAPPLADAELLIVAGDFNLAYSNAANGTDIGGNSSGMNTSSSTNHSESGGDDGGGSGSGGSVRIAGTNTSWPYSSLYGRLVQASGLTDARVAASGLTAEEAYRLPPGSSAPTLAPGPGQPTLPPPPPPLPRRWRRAGLRRAAAAASSGTEDDRYGGSGGTSSDSTAAGISGNATVDSIGVQYDGVLDFVFVRGGGLAVANYSIHKEFKQRRYVDGYPAVADLTLAVAAGVWPQEDVNYTFIVVAYAICNVLFAIVWSLEKIYNVEALEGASIIFVPFVPCLLWSLVMRRQWLSGMSNGARARKSS